MNKLRKIRKHAKVSQRKLAIHTQLISSVICLFEKQKIQPLFQTADQIATFLGVPIEEIPPDFKRTSSWPKSIDKEVEDDKSRETTKVV
ncbi:MAG: helix-turn-helix domain-containing protein [Thermotogae bacterium]|jgi:DNA-binding XRE family transcriptional regulator|nr:helix-turn-helix domain-containing protein [Thermotogota bacterium]MCL5033231.1 helix-turn-helix domain-containing protein [Thermotogota bacterium]